MDRLDGGPSDHNAFGIDIDVGQLWRTIPRNSPRRSPRGFTVDNKRRTTKFIQAASELVRKAGVDELLGQLESVIKAEEEESVIKELMEQTDGKLTECMLLAEKRVQPSARARSHAWSPKLVQIQQKAGLLMNLLMVATNTPTIKERVHNRFQRNATNLDPQWETPEFTVEKIRAASKKWSRKSVRATRNAEKLRREHLQAQREAMVDKVIPEEVQKA